MAGIYVHIPFCHSKCIYCDFFSTPNLKSSVRFVDSIVQEYHRRASELTEPIRTIYFGGGTPSILPTSLLAKIVEALPTEDVEEFTIEVNPEDVTREAVKGWRGLGVNRVSMGIQSFNDAELRIIGRRHTADDARRAIECLRSEGITNMSCDLIYGLPSQDIESWVKSLTELLLYQLPHLSAYCLSYEPGTALYARMLVGKVKPSDDDILEEMYVKLTELTGEYGYEHYEISNFSLPGMKSRHNSSYWDETSYLGLGPGAHSFDGKVRRYNRNDIKTYLDTADVTEIDEENENERFNDRLITTLRTANGLDIDKLTPPQAEYVIEVIKPFISTGSMTIDGKRIRISEKAWLRADAILRELIIV